MVKPDDRGGDRNRDHDRDGQESDGSLATFRTVAVDRFRWAFRLHCHANPRSGSFAETSTSPTDDLNWREGSEVAFGRLPWNADLPPNVRDYSVIER